MLEVGLRRRLQRVRTTNTGPNQLITRSFKNGKQHISSAFTFIRKDTSERTVQVERRKIKLERKKNQKLMWLQKTMNLLML